MRTILLYLTALFIIISTFPICILGFLYFMVRASFATGEKWADRLFETYEKEVGKNE